MTTAANPYTRTGYTFTGWNTAANGSGTAATAGGSFTMPAANTTLHAQWKTLYNAWADGFLPANNVSNPAGDNDGDTLTNLQEYAFGTDPTTGSNGTITYTGNLLTACGPPVARDLSPGTGGVDYRAVFCRRKNWQAEGLTYTVQFSVDLDYTPGNFQTVTMTAENATVLATDAADVMEAVSVPYPWFIPYTRNTIPGYEKPTFFRLGVSSSN